jgi:thiamine-monophosphate kinase
VVKSSMRKSAALSEAEIIARAARAFRVKDPCVIVGIGDDAAVLRRSIPDKAGRGAADSQQIVTTDVLIEGVHFDLRLLSLADVGYKALMVNLSDIAAMGGRPAQAFATLGVPRSAAAGDIDQLLAGVKAAAAAGQVSLAGGDTTRSPQWLLGFTVLGELDGPALLRSGASPGDNVWHSGQLGLSQTGLHRLWAGETSKRRAASIAAHRRPQARLGLGSYLQQAGCVTACLDLSDSLSQCLVQLAAASGVGLRLDFSAYQFHPEVLGFRRALRNWPAGGERAFYLPARWRPEKTGARFSCLAEYVLAGAEDYELLFAAPAGATDRMLAEAPMPLTRLGQIVPEPEGMRYCGEDGVSRELHAIGFEHL